MHRIRLASLTAVVLLVAACSGGGATAAPSDAEASPTAPPASAATRVEVALSDALRIEPDPLVVAAGVPVTFVVTNTGSTDHEFYLGDEAAQTAHEDEMAEMGGMGHDEPMGIAVAPGETKELTVTFDEPGTILAGCHVAGHYQGGMKAAVMIQG